MVHSAFRLASILLDSRASRLGVAIAGISLMGILLLQLHRAPGVCEFLVMALDRSAEHLFGALLVLFCICFVLFLTVMPLGTVTIIIAGYFLGPLAGVAQYVALVAASMVLYELGRDSDPERLGRRLADFPAITRVAGLARRRGILFTVSMRLVPVVPSAVASLGASYFSVSRRDFLTGTLLAGWCRPVGFALLGTLGRFAPVCGIDPSIGGIFT